MAIIFVKHSTWSTQSQYRYSNVTAIDDENVQVNRYVAVLDVLRRP
jgi:hypothetical protein